MGGRPSCPRSYWVGSGLINRFQKRLKFGAPLWPYKNMTTRAKKCETFCLQSFFSYSRNQIFFLSPCLSQVIERKIAGILFRGITNGSEITHCQSIKGVHLKMLQFIVQVFTVCSTWIPRVSFKRRLFIHFSVHPLVNNVFLENCNFLHGYNSIKMTRQVFFSKNNKYKNKNNNKKNFLINEATMNPKWLVQFASLGLFYFSLVSLAPDQDEFGQTFLP